MDVLTGEGSTCVLANIGDRDCASVIFPQARRPHDVKFFFFLEKKDPQLFFLLWWCAVIFLIDSLLLLFVIFFSQNEIDRGICYFGRRGSLRWEKKHRTFWENEAMIIEGWHPEFLRWVGVSLIFAFDVRNGLVEFREEFVHWHEFGRVVWGLLGRSGSRWA